MTRMCCDDKDRPCDETCAAYNKEGYSITRVPRFDRTLPTPQWTWSGTAASNAIVCKKHGFTIEVLNEISPPEESHHGRDG